MSETEQETEEVQDKLDQLKNDRKKALRAEKDLGEKEHDDAEDVDGRTAARFIGTFDGTALFQIVTTKLNGFPIGSDAVDEYTEDELKKWVEGQEPEIVSLADVDGFRTNGSCDMPQCVGTDKHRTHAVRGPSEDVLEMCDACLNSGWRANVEVLD